MTKLSPVDNLSSLNFKKIIMTTFEYPTSWSSGRKYYLKDHATVTASLTDTVICDNTLTPAPELSFKRYKDRDDTGARIDQWILFCPGQDNFIFRRICITVWLLLSTLHIVLVVSRERPSVVIQHFFLPNGVVVALLAALFRYTLIVVNHSSRDTYFRGTVFRKIAVNLIRRLAREIWYVSEPQLHFFNGKLQSDKNFVIGNPIDAQRWTVSKTIRNTGRNVVMNMAYPSHRKGTDLLIHAVRLLKERGSVLRSNMTVAIVGKGPWDNEFIDLARANNVDDIIEFKGFLDAESLNSLMRDCSFSVLPSRDEGFSYAVAESLACGKPVVTTSCGGPEWFVTPETGIVVPPDDLNAFVEAFERMMHTFREYDPDVLHKSIEKRFSYPVFSSVMRQRLSLFASENA